MSVKKVLIICGPTGSGKTSLALRLAGNEPISIISADSRQVFKGLDILTGKDIPTGFYREKDYYTDGVVRLWGLGLVEPDKTMNAAEFSAYAHRVIALESGQGRSVIVVGGTGFYLQALVDPHSLAAVAPNEKLRLELNRLPLADLQQKLKVLAPRRLAAMNESDAKNPRRLIRAIEVASSVSHPQPEQYPHLEFSWVGLSLPLPVLKQRIASRVNARFTSSVSEVRDLLATYPDQNLPIYTSLGLKPILLFLDGSLDRNQAAELWTRQEYSYVKRQLTWFKKQPQIIWYDQVKSNALELDQLI